MAKPIVLGYWSIHGLASCIRYLLEYVGEEYVEKEYDVSNMAEWFDKEKNTLGLFYPDLPYLIDNDVKMTEHLAIMKYLARKHNLVGKTEEEIRFLEQTESFINDARFKVGMVAYNTVNYEEAKTQSVGRVRDKMPYLDKLFATNEYVLGSRLTYVDILVYDVLLLLRTFEPTLVTDYENLVKFIDRIASLPRIADYLSSSRYKKRYFFNQPYATFKGQL